MKKQAVILAAGKSTRTYPLTLTRPKPLLPVAGTTLIEHNLNALRRVGVEEVAIVVGYRKDQLISHLEGLGLALTFHWVEQKEALGTAHALSQVASLGKMEDFLLLMGDDVYFYEDLEILARYPLGILGFEVEEASRFGVLEVQGEHLKGILEKPPHIQRGLVNTGAYSFTSEIFDYLDVEASSRGELELTDSLTELAARKEVQVVKGEWWIPVTYPWSLLDVNERLLSTMDGDVSSEIEIEPGAHLRGPVRVGKGTIIKSGAYIEGPVWIGENCTLGPNCYIRPNTTLGSHCKVGNGCEVKGSLFFDNVKMGHLSYVGDSIMGEAVNIGAGTLVANLKHDHGTVQSKIQGKVVDSGRRKLGTIVGDGAHLAIGTKIYPGRKIWPGAMIFPGEVIKKDRMGKYR